MIKHTLMVIFFLNLSAFAADETKEFDSKGLKTLVVENLSGKVSIGGTVTLPYKSYVKVSKNKFSDKCKLTMEKLEDKLILKVEKSNILDSQVGCDVDFQVSVLEVINLDLSNGSGDIIINRLQADSFTFKVGSGDVLVTNMVTKKIDGKSGNGKIHIWKLTGGGVIKSGSGDISLYFGPSDLTGELDIKSGSGDADITFAKGTKIKTSFKAGSGELSNELGDSADATFKVSMKTGSGNLKIKSHE